MVNQRFQQALGKIREEQEFFREIRLSEQSGSSGGSIDLLNHELNINYDPEFVKKICDKDAEEFLKKKNIPKREVLETLVADLLHHEIGHRGSRKYSGCPADVKTLSEKFLDPIYEVTKIENKNQLAYFANMLTDIINDTTIKRLDHEEGLSDYAGFYLFLKEQGVTAGKFSKLYESFARLSLYFNGDQNDKKLLEQYLSYDPEVNTAIRNFLERTEISQMKTVVHQGSKEIKVRNRPAIREYLMDEKNWEKISTIFAEEFFKFMEEQPKERLFGSSGNQQQQDSSSGSQDTSQQQGGSSGNPSENSDPENASEQLSELIAKELANQFSNDNGFGRELQQQDTLRKIIRGRKAGSGPGWMTNFEHLVNYYELLASDKLFELTVPPQEGRSYPLVDLGQRTFDFEDDAPRDIRGIFFDRDSKSIELYVARHLYEINVRVKKERSDTPDIVFGLLDTSSSMLDQMPKGLRLGEAVNPKSYPQWKVNSKYHVSLIAYFMMVERFSELGIYESDAYFANFSYDTVLSKGLMNSKIEALCPQFGGTMIDLNKIEKTLSKKGTLVFTISDGEIGNEKNLSKKIIDIAEYNPCFHVQIGNHSSFSKKLERSGVYVKLVQEEKDLYDFVIDLTEYLGGGKS
ncbi:MAG: hypothetical protein ABIA37_00135 [Candidatus Woesearchaeota archaeon]|nr:hypothetical protein [Nanoarchaeota archaeon]MBU1643742.1 hypothetical protein [Nanoarchaeota archaeon]MBU1976630.1 hypothetical protein [Nanoarchaeota archaeon]